MSGTQPQWVSPRTVLICLLVVYAGVGYFAAQSMIGLDNLHVVAAVYAALALWGAIEVLLHPNLWFANPKNADGILAWETSNWGKNGQRQTVTKRVHQIARRRVVWPLSIILVGSCCCSFPAEMLAG